MMDVPGGREMAKEAPIHHAALIFPQPLKPILEELVVAGLVTIDPVGG